ncbi:LOW QUALITY PROTEIN: hypothetical protein TorRG33x02_047410 [Trema orientale]|uniref:Uncharacterized protein n=1 Tax=Trema orientale TaxID=63057 RepID=A0A2P5FP61_TREOI|nr:LOW QUALITY PROTEIN: hypothetical protein TorRG33x02_047410 [Trema orientale]
MLQIRKLGTQLPQLKIRGPNFYKLDSGTICYNYVINT